VFLFFVNVEDWGAIEVTNGDDDDDDDDDDDNDDDDDDDDDDGTGGGIIDVTNDDDNELQLSLSTWRGYLFLDGRAQAD